MKTTVRGILVGLAIVGLLITMAPQKGWSGPDDLEYQIQQLEKDIEALDRASGTWDVFGAGSQVMEDVFKIAAEGPEARDKALAAVDEDLRETDREIEKTQQLIKRLKEMIAEKEAKGDLSGIFELEDMLADAERQLASLETHKNDIEFAEYWLNSFAYDAPSASGPPPNGPGPGMCWDSVEQVYVHCSRPIGPAVRPTPAPGPRPAPGPAVRPVPGPGPRPTPSPGPVVGPTPSPTPTPSPAASIVAIPAMLDVDNGKPYIAKGVVAPPNSYVRVGKQTYFWDGTKLQTVSAVDAGNTGSTSPTMAAKARKGKPNLLAEFKNKLPAKQAAIQVISMPGTGPPPQATGRPGGRGPSAGHFSGATWTTPTFTKTGPASALGSAPGGPANGVRMNSFRTGRR